MLVDGNAASKSRSWAAAAAAGQVWTFAEKEPMTVQVWFLPFILNQGCRSTPVLR
jgi:hypothetical protein